MGTSLLLLALLLATASACTTEGRVVVKEVIVKSRQCRIKRSLKFTRCACFLLFKTGVITPAQTVLCQRLYRVKDLSELASGCKSTPKFLKKLLARLRIIAANCFKPFPSPIEVPKKLDIATEGREEVEDEISLMRQIGTTLPTAGFEKCLKCLSCIQIGNCITQNED